MAEQAVRREVTALRFTVRNPPKRLDEFEEFFSGLHGMYRIAEVTGRLQLMAVNRLARFRDDEVARMFYETTAIPRGLPAVANLSMLSPLEFILEATQAGTYTLGCLYLVLKAPERLANMPALHAQWHEGRLRAEILKAQRRAFQRRLEAGDIDVLALGFDPSGSPE